MKLGVSGHSRESQNKEERKINKAYKKHREGTSECI